MIDIKVLIRKVVPNYELNGEMEEEFKSLLTKLSKKLQPIFSKYISIEDVPDIDEDDVSLKQKIVDILSENNLVLISANSTKKKMKNLGIDLRKLIVSGGPLHVEDYKVINPNLPDKTLEGLEKKCERLLDQLRNENWDKKKLYFMYEKDSIADQLILDKINVLQEQIGTKITPIKVNSWDILDE